MTITKERYNEIAAELKELKQKEQDIVISNMPKFERGITEASIEREQVIWQDLKEVFIAHKIQPDINFSIVSDNQASNDSIRPQLTCAGVKVSLVYLVYPIDGKGNSGRISGDELNKLQDIRKTTEELEKELMADESKPH